MNSETQGQVPTNPADPGQVPDEQTTPTSTPEPKIYDEAYVKQLRAEAASHRTKLTAYERQEEDRRQASLTETQKAVERAEAAERALNEANERNHKRTILSVAKDAGAVDPDVILQLLDRSNLDMSDDAAVHAAITSLLDGKPYLKAAVEAKPTTPKITPPQSPRGNRELNYDDLSKMSSQEIAKLPNDVFEAAVKRR